MSKTSRITDADVVREEKQLRLYFALSAAIDVALHAAHEDDLSVGDQLEIIAGRLGHMVCASCPSGEREQMLLRLTAQMSKTCGVKIAEGAA